MNRCRTPKTKHHNSLKYINFFMMLWIVYFSLCFKLSANMLIVAPLKVKVTEDIYLEIPTPINDLNFISQQFMERELPFNYRLYTRSEKFFLGFDNVNKTDVDCIRSKSCFQSKLSSTVSDVIIDETKYTDKSESVKCRHTLTDIIKGNRYICYESYAYTDDKISYIIESQYHC
ncbi:hypothetical protein N7931_13345, partial [Catenovulum sp. 2E275]|uniref:hypothetical protein n=1 Tax=Catenovulum sp. 2E275 TaxID=2980497 RepID=UPI0021D17DE1